MVFSLHPPAFYLSIGWTMEELPYSSLLCGRCRVPVALDQSGAEIIVRCPECGESDTLEAARREAGQHSAHKLIQRALYRDPIEQQQPELAFRFIEEAD